MEFQSKFKKGVSLIHKFDKSLWYSVQCECGDNECGSIVEIECDHEFGFIQLHFYKDVKFDFWRYPEYEFFKFDWLRRFIYRWKKAIILAFTGEIKLHGDFLINHIVHIDNFIEALQEGRDYCIKAKERPDISGEKVYSGKMGYSGKIGYSDDMAEQSVVGPSYETGIVGPSYETGIVASPGEINIPIPNGMQKVLGAFDTNGRLIEAVSGTSGSNGVFGKSGESLGQDLRDLNQRMLEK